MERERERDGIISVTRKRKEKEYGIMHRNPSSL